MPYEIVFQPSVEKDLRKISAENKNRIFSRIEALASDPFSVQVTKLTGTLGMYRVRAGDYRIIYEVNQEANLINIHYVRHRREAYRSL